jgi:hypothetical protein
MGIDNPISGVYYLVSSEGGSDLNALATDGRIRTTPLKLDLDPALRRRLNEFVRRENERLAPAGRVSQKGIITVALSEYLDQLERAERAS